MARSKDAPKLKWEWRDCITCNQKFRYVLIDGTVMKEATCKKCTYKTCPICQVHHQTTGACCSKACTAKKREATNTKLYGSSNVFASDTIKDRIKETLVVKYGVNHPDKSDIVKRQNQEGVRRKSTCGSNLIFDCACQAPRTPARRSSSMSPPRLSYLLIRW